MLIQGRVQGIGYRWFVKDAADRVGATGWVRNLPSGEVEAEVQGDPEALQKLLRELKEGHPWAQVTAVRTQSADVREDSKSFGIL